MLDALLAPLQIRPATVRSITESDHVLVQDDAHTTLTCERLQTSDSGPLSLHPDDRVLVASPPDAETGYVLGRLSTSSAAPLHPATSEDGKVVEVILPEGVETVRIAGRQITIAADESLSLECGGGSVRIDKRGKVVVLGTDITSRAKRLHKVKGASVAIN